MDAYESTKKQERLHNIASTIKRTAVVAALAEIVISYFGPPFVCLQIQIVKAGALAAAAASAENTDGVEAGSFTPEGLSDMSDEAQANYSESLQGSATLSGTTALGSGEETIADNANVMAVGTTLAGALLMQVAVRYLLGDLAGEGTHVQRAVYYGVQELAIALSGDKADAAECLRQRADEYGRLADSLTERYSTQGLDIPPPEVVHDGGTTGEIVTTSGGGVTDALMSFQVVFLYKETLLRQVIIVKTFQIPDNLGNSFQLAGSGINVPQELYLD